MTFKFSALGAAALFAASFSAASAQELVGEAGGWEIYRDASMGGGCYMTSAFEDGSIVQLGYDISEDAAFFTVFNGDWTDITEGEVYPMTFDIDGQPWTADGHGMNTGDLGGILVMVENEDFFVDLATKNSLIVSNEAGEVAHLDLGGTRDAVIATSDCVTG
ncbi:hypothetical protein Q9295_01435 [Xinfangfangia sp. CPCC 101601]|uniref:Uncharacterized protein n=1 Tax=Pseudogemmobacter lacusdianii TaxID=3069608 RepID=A0ABU0VTI5_9RHOB|nr:hypothetical protein [Xinfangfangia sp. CPCC 101601]MDQ2065021.1 hypothetical protein [Xinfangfangia sp. CPCC 101601]